MALARVCDIDGAMGRSGNGTARGKTRQFALSIAAMAGACALIAGCGLSPEQEADAIEQGILSSPGSEDLWATIKTHYPDDFADLVGRLRALDAQERTDNARTEAVAAEWLRDFFARIGPDAVKAPPKAMLTWSTTEGELYAALQRASQDQCAAMTMGEWVYVDDKQGAVAAAITRRNAAMVRAAAAGRDTPEGYLPPDKADFEQLGKAIAATGIAPDLQAALGSDEAMEALPPEDQCKVGVAVYTGLTALPDDVEPRVAAYMLSPL
jgi:hypothetical protein